MTNGHLAASLATAFVLVGCVSVDPLQTSNPTAGSSLAGATASVAVSASPAFTPTPLATLPQTPSPTAIATATATATTTATTATASATAEVTATPGATPTTAPTPDVTATPTGTPTALSPDELFNDEFDDPSTGWGTGPTGGGMVDYSDGALQFDVDDTESWMWSRRETGADNAALKVVGEFVPQGDGKFGLLCAQGDDSLVGAIVDTAGGWAFVSIGAAGAEVLLDDPDAGLDIAGLSTVIGLDCAGTATGALRMQLNLTGTGPVAIYESQDGPASFDRVAAYAAAFEEAFTVRLDNALAFGTGDPSGVMDTDASELLAHIPANWQGTCFDTALPPTLGQNATALVTCFIGDAVTDSEVAEYAQFATKADMDAAYGLRVDRFPVESPVDSCADGPGEHSYTIGNEEAGRLLCAAQFRGIRFDWTDDRLTILSSLVDHDASYAATFQDWVDGGPNI